MSVPRKRSWRAGARPAGQIFRRRRKKKKKKKKKKAIRPLGVDGTRRECLNEVRLDRVPLHFEQHTDAVRGRPAILEYKRASVSAAVALLGHFVRIKAHSYISQFENFPPPPCIVHELAAGGGVYNSSWLASLL